MIFPKPGNGNVGWIDVSIASTPDWLRFPWASGAIVAPAGRAAFGYYAGGGKALVYMRENY